MSRYTGPTTRINRRFGQAIFAPTKAFERKPHPPGQHGPRLRRKYSEYAIGLNVWHYGKTIPSNFRKS
jgi:small subunit ribosomal protein S4